MKKEDHDDVIVIKEENSDDSSAMKEEEFDKEEVADQPRLPWAWKAHGFKTREPYYPVVVGKWWSMSNEEVDELKKKSSATRHSLDHVGRIMETELDERLEGEKRCSACQDNDQECWAYSKRGGGQIRQPGDACARCRMACTRCSLSNRKRKNKSTPPRNVRRRLEPKIGLGNRVVEGETRGYEGNSCEL